MRDTGGKRSAGAGFSKGKDILDKQMCCFSCRDLFEAEFLAF